nr:immunoglobulin heavy chain junction region [Macaca mulatta]
CTSYDYDSW